MPSTDASMVARAATLPSRNTRTDDCPFTSTHSMVTPVQKCEENAAMNFATRSRPESAGGADLTQLRQQSERLSGGSEQRQSGSVHSHNDVRPLPMHHGYPRWVGVPAIR